MLKSLITAASLLALSAPAAFAFNGLPADGAIGNASIDTIVVQTRSAGAFKSARRSGVRKKSPRQKCLDMMLPQDGVDCLKKLKAKKK